MKRTRKNVDPQDIEVEKTSSILFPDPQALAKDLMELWKLLEEDWGEPETKEGG